MNYSNLIYRLKTWWKGKKLKKSIRKNKWNPNNENLRNWRDRIYKPYE